ncbi:MAG TPA: hypothetical protein VG713_01135 [Pirellulales bacterium]|nr:hypothetical protein [Pirellulales bacterium]
MTRIICFAAVCLAATCANAQQLVYPALPQPPARSAYPYAFPQAYAAPGWNGQVPFAGGGMPALAAYGPYGFGGYGGYGLGYGRFGYGFRRYGYGARGYYPPNPFGNMNWLPPNPPSPYYVAPSGREYMEQATRNDQARYAELLLLHNGH